jgi:hypothetical protein
MQKCIQRWLILLILKDLLMQEPVNVCKNVYKA